MKFSAATFDPQLSPEDLISKEERITKLVEIAQDDYSISEIIRRNILIAIPIFDTYHIIDTILDRAQLESRVIHSNIKPGDDPPRLSFDSIFIMEGVEREGHSIVQNMRTKLSNMRRVMQERGIPERKFRIEKRDIFRVPNHPLTLIGLHYTENMMQNAVRVQMHMHMALNRDDVQLLLKIRG